MSPPAGCRAPDSDCPGTDTKNAETAFANLRFDLHPEASSSDLEIAAFQRRGIVLHLRNRP